MQAQTQAPLLFRQSCGGAQIVLPALRLADLVSPARGCRCLPPAVFQLFEGLEQARSSRTQNSFLAESWPSGQPSRLPSRSSARPPVRRGGDPPLLHIERRRPGKYSCIPGPGTPRAAAGPPRAAPARSPPEAEQARSFSIFQEQAVGSAPGAPGRSGAPAARPSAAAPRAACEQHLDRHAQPLGGDPGVAVAQDRRPGSAAAARRPPSPPWPGAAGSRGAPGGTSRSISATTASSAPRRPPRPTRLGPASSRSESGSCPPGKRARRTPSPSARRSGRARRKAFSPALSPS